MTNLMNLQYFLASRPRGEPNASHVPARDVPVPELAPGEMLLRNLYISLDPAILGWERYATVPAAALNKLDEQTVLVSAAAGAVGSVVWQIGA